MARHRISGRRWPLAIAGLAAACLLALPAPLLARDWTSMGPADAPARVAAITFGTGNEISRQRETCWGAWCVGFVPTGAIITDARACSGPGFRACLKIEGLSCRNAVAGRVPCYMTLLKPAKVKWSLCQLIQPINRNELRILFKIRCPTDLRLG